jgi:chemotaxis signal transduction protein
MMSVVSAWQLDLGSGLWAAVGEREMIHLMSDPPALFEIPHSPSYCRRVFVWQGRILPLMDLPLRLLGQHSLSQGLLAVVAFQKYPEATIRHGALLLDSPPVRIRVEDSQACDLPESPSGWRHLAIACFEQAQQGPVPILDLSRVFLLPPASASGTKLTDADQPDSLPVQETLAMESRIDPKE